MDIAEKLRIRADWHERHKLSGPAYCYTGGDQDMDMKAADEIEQLRAELERLYAKHGYAQTAAVLGHQQGQEKP